MNSTNRYNGALKRGMFRFLLPLVALHLAGCSTDPDVDVIPPEEQGVVSIEVGLEIPLNSRPSTRAMDAGDETAVKNMDILVFLVEGTEETFAYRAHNTTEPVVTDNNVKFITSLRRSENCEKYRLVMFANLRAEIDEAMQNIREGDAKEDIISAIKFSQPGPWPTAENDIRPIPMWGETVNASQVQRSTTMGSFGGTVQMLRALAKVDILLALETGDDKPGFELSTIKVYNALGIHAAAPGNDAGYTAESRKVSAPTVVTRVNMTPLEYPVHNSLATIGIAGEIYIGEAQNSTAAAEKNLCLLIGGYYTEAGHEKNTDKITWYRVDFRVPGTADLQERLDILRNHQYIININYVGGPGDEEEEDAFRRGPYDMVTDIIVWSEGVITDVVWDGQYYLGVSRTLFELSRDPQLADLTVTTNYPQGWKPTIDGKYEDWLSVHSGGFTATDTHDPLEFQVTENGTGSERTGYIDLVAGNLTLPLKVVQSIYSTVNIEILDDNSDPVETLWFDAENPVSRRITVNWVPVTSECFGAVGSAEYGVGPMDFSAGDNPARMTMYDGTHDFNLRPVQFTPAEPFEELSARLYFTTGGGNPRHRFDRSTAGQVRTYSLYTGALRPGRRYSHIPHRHKCRLDGGSYRQCPPRGRTPTGGRKESSAAPLRFPPYRIRYGSYHCNIYLPSYRRNGGNRYAGCNY